MRSENDIAPWNSALFNRCNLLRIYIKNGHRIAVLVYESPDTSTFRYRGYNLFQITEDINVRWKCIYFFKDELENIKLYLSDIDLITLIRVKWTFDIEKFVCDVKSKNIPVLFDVDDLVFNLDFLPLVMNTLNVECLEERYEYWFNYISRIYFTASKADGFITTNYYLANLLSEKFQKESKVIPNFLNREQIEFSNQYLLKKVHHEDSFTIGYFSGTPSHVNDFRECYQEIMQLLSEYSHINLEVVGFMEFPNEMLHFIKNGRIKLIPLVNFLELQRLISMVDVNIAPLVTNTFTNCKSELKFFEAAAVKTITCATPTYTFSNCIKEGITGFLCNQGDWYNKIKNIYLKNIDIENVNNQAYEYTMNTYAGSRIIEKIEEVYDGFL